MKQIFLSLIAFFIVLFPAIGQSTWLKPETGYITNDIIADKAFSCHDISGNTLYAIDSDGLYGYDLATMQQTLNLGKAPASYKGAWVSFVTADPDGTKVWVGYTSSGLVDDRIFSVDINTGVWTHAATLPGNFDMECHNGKYYVSGLNKEGWDGVNDVNCISLLDVSGANQHKKIIEIGGNSTGLAIDGSGNVYNAKYDPSGSSVMYKWSATAIEGILAANDKTFLTKNDATVVTTMPGNGPYDCTTDAAGRLIFNCNDFSGGSFVSLWNGKTGETQNYDKIGVYCGGSFAWFAMIKAKGDLANGGKIYMLNYGDPLVEIRQSLAPSIKRNIDDKLLPINAPQTEINLADYFSAKAGTTIEYAASAATNSILSSVVVDGSTLKVDYLADATGSAEITITGTTSGDATQTSFTIEVRDIDYSNGAFIVNEDWFGHSNGTVNYMTNDQQMVYRAFQNENPGKSLGVTTQFGTIYGNRFFFMSKQGPRLVVANANTMKEQVSIEEFVANESGNKSDGRAFVGVTPEKGYISTTKGIYLFDINTLTVGAIIENTSGEVGNMLRAGNYVFAEKTNEIYIIDATTNQIVKTIAGTSISGVVQALDGYVYVGSKSKLLKVDPYTLEQQEIALPSGIEIPSAFGWAWYAGSFCASATENALFWSKPGGWSGSNIIYKYVIGDESSLSAPFITLESGMELYGAGLRVHPATNQVYVTGKKSGWGDNSLYNKLYVFDGSTGAEVSRKELEPYYWFPAMPVFPDAHAPVLNLTNIEMEKGDQPIRLQLTSLATDADNNDAAILVSVVENNHPEIIEATIDGRELVLAQKQTAGVAQIKLQAISNGISSEASFNVTVGQATGIPVLTDGQIKVYPAPFNTHLTISSKQLQESRYQLVNLIGQVVQSGLLNQTENTISTTSLKPGAYILMINTTEGVITQKVVKQ